jgi:hypothetical protein
VGEGELGCRAGPPDVLGWRPMPGHSQRAGQHGHGGLRAGPALSLIGSARARAVAIDVAIQPRGTVFVVWTRHSS